MVISPGLLIVIFEIQVENWLNFHGFLKNKKVVVILGLVNLKNLEITDYVFPQWSYILGEFMTVTTLFGILGYLIYSIIDVLFIHKKVIAQSLSLFFSK